MNRKGAVFTLMAIVVVAFLLTSERLTSSEVTISSSETTAAKTRITVMNNFISTFEQHAANSLATSGYFAFVNLSKKVQFDQAFITSVNSTFVNCTIGNNITWDESGTDVNHECLPNEFLLKVSLNDIVSLAASELGIATTYYLHDAWVTEENPMELVFWLNISYNVSDPFAEWSVPGKIVRVDVPMSDIPDPVYEYLDSNNYVSTVRNLSLTPLNKFQFNTSNFEAFYENGSYLIVESESPSILQRFSGDTTSVSSCCGIQSVVRASELISIPSVYRNYSMIDHHFVSHLMSTLPGFNCSSSQVRPYQMGTERVIIEEDQYFNVFNLTSTLPSCMEPSS